MTDPVEMTLLERVCAGDHDAFDDLYARLEPMVARFVRRLVGNVLEVDDIVQETFIGFYRHIREIDPPHMLRPYLFRIARNRAYDLLRRQGRYDQVSIDEDDDDPVQVRIAFDLSQLNTSPEDAASWLLLYMEVRDAIERLPELGRQALILYAEEQLSYAEIAQVMNVSIGTVKSRMFHAKRRLRELLSDDALRLIREELGDS
ncbi:MAG: RNA polymerase sigma factor [Chloroflexota bacterium]|nr:RNA polymerase sigma factor [Chloroflexota bacterium]